MKGRWIYLLYGLLGLAVALWLYQQVGGDERKIKGKLQELEQLVEKDGPESDLVAANKGRQVGLLFSRDFEIYLEPFGQHMDDRARLAQVMLGYRRPAQRIDVGFRDVQIELLEGQPKRARMDAVAAVNGTVDGQLRRESYRFAFHWLEEDGIWRIEQADLVEVRDGLF